MSEDCHDSNNMPPRNKCPYCHSDSMPGKACLACQADWDAAMEDLFDALDATPAESKGRAFEAAGHLLKPPK